VASQEESLGKLQVQQALLLTCDSTGCHVVLSHLKRAVSLVEPVGSLVSASPAVHLLDLLTQLNHVSLAHLPAKQLVEVFVVEQCPLPGVLATAELSDALRFLPHASFTPTHIFVQNGRLAGISISVLFDGGATTSFVD
jgi:hypothetical protein